MGRYVFKRFCQMLIVMFFITLFTFFLVSMVPGDPVYAMLGEEVPPELYDQVYHELGLDLPIFQRYLSWLAGVFTGDMGTSYQFHESVAYLLGERVPITLYLAFLAFFISIPLGILFGVLSAVLRGKAADNVVTMFANIVSALPQFWLAILLMYVLSMQLGLLPSYGFTWPTENFGMSVAQTIMPVICLALGSVASTTRQTRSSMLEVIRQDYVRTARSKGLKEKTIVFIHALKNALIPVVTIMGNRLTTMIGGAMFVESVFSIPGLGSLMVKAITSRDIEVVQGCVLVTALVVCVINLAVDIMYAVIDPRIRVESD